MTQPTSQWLRENAMHSSACDTYDTPPRCTCGYEDRVQRTLIRELEAALQSQQELNLMLEAEIAELRLAVGA